MERKTISIEPYVEAHGILGTRLEVNPKAADSVMKRTALRRNVVVVKGDEREGRSYDGSDEIVVGKSLSKSDKTATETKLYTLVNQSGDWVVFLHDQEISDEVQEKAKKSKKNQPADYDKKFAGYINSALTEAISTASVQEKVQITKASLIGSSRVAAASSSLLLGIVFGSGVLIEVGRIANIIPAGYLYPVGTAEHEDIWKASVVATSFYVSLLAVDLTTALHHFTDKSILNKWEYLVPHLPVLSTGLGELSLELNKGRLVRLKDSKG